MWPARGPDLPADGVLEAEVAELRLQLLDHRLPDLVDLVVFFKGIALLLAAVAPYRRNVDHPVAELDEGASLDGNINCSKT